VAILQGLISLLTRSVGKIFSSLFDWAVIALFGRAEGGRKLLLSGLVAAAAMWPVLVVGIAAPKLALFVVAFVPLSGSVSAGVMRAVWIALAVLVPVTVGIVLRLQAPPDRPRAGWLGSIARGFPITLGLCSAFLILLITVPVLRISSAVRGRQDVDVPLLTTGPSYDLATKLVAETLRRHGFPMAEADPPWWSALPSAILKRVGREALSPYVPARSVYLRGGDLEIVLYPNALMLRGSVADTARAHGLLAEALTGHADMLQTVSAEAQDIERQIQRVWTVYRENPEAHRNAWALSSRLGDIAAEIARRSLSFDEWQIVYRQALQLSRTLNGEPQLVEQALGQESPAEASALQLADSAYRWLPARVLLRRILDTGSRFLLKQIELARTEVRADLAAEVRMARLLAGAGVGALLAISVLLLAAVAGLAAWLPAWLAALGLGVVILSISAAIGYGGWQRRVRAVLPVTRKSVTEDVQWIKRRIA
jgi:hypothetical protein